MASLNERVILVTGARVKIGFQAALKLLRCGAFVIATSRFPMDTATRFSQQARPCDAALPCLTLFPPGPLPALKC